MGLGLHIEHRVRGFPTSSEENIQITLVNVLDWHALHVDVEMILKQFM